jgi:hypothetical protein
LNFRADPGVQAGFIEFVQGSNKMSLVMYQARQKE